MNRFLKKIAVVLSFAVAFSAMPLGVHAACTTHTATEDGNGNVLYYVTASEHYTVCSDCYTMYDHTAHTDNGSGVCAGCAAVLDNGTTTHTHNLTANSYVNLNPFGHMVECSGCPGEFNTHTNCVVGDQDGDGTWDCDYCGWGGPIIGVGGGSTHTHTYQNNNWTIDPEEHSAICDTCEENAPFAPHTDNGSGNCTDCGAIVVFDAGKNLYVHNHTSNGSIVQTDVDNHLTTCGTCARIYWEAHYDNNTDNECDLCQDPMSGQNCSHTPVVDSNGVPVYETDSMEHWYRCANCGERTDVETHGDDPDNADGLCDKCGYGTPICQHTPAVDSNGNNVYEIGPAGHRTICANCSQPYGSGELHYDNDNDSNCDVCGETILCNHSTAGRWWDTDVIEHTLHCTCGYPVAPAANHTDADADGLCDDCGVGVDAQLEHTHNWDTAWSQNNDNTEHFHDCTDPACTRSTDVHAVVDADSDGVCDNCANNQGGTTPPSCSHVPSVNGDGSYVYVVGEKEHLHVCDNCHEEYSTGAVHTDTDADEMCDECRVPVSYTNGEYIHTHTLNPDGPFINSYNHHDRCDTCGIDFNVADHTDTDGDGRCDVCNTTVTLNGSQYLHYCTNLTVKVMDSESHAEVCPECDQTNNWDNHHDTDSDGKCDQCGTNIDADGKHIHTPDGNWNIFDDMEHTAPCAECDEWAYEAHYDNVENTNPSNATPDGICDACDFGAPCEHENQNFWWSTDETEHARFCGDCGEYVDSQGSHEDTDSDGKCDACGVGVTDGKHTHVWQTSWAQDNSDENHFRNCSDTACTVSTDAGAHCDTDADNTCDVCGDTLNPDINWCTSHTANGDKIVDDDYHYDICADCNNRFNPEQHVAGSDMNSEGDKHYYICEVCGSDMGEGEAHVTSDNWMSSDDANYHMAVCDICYCMVESTKEAHVDEDADFMCDKCWVSVDENGAHIHDLSGFWTPEYYQHVEYCYGCGMNINAEDHTDTDDDGRCDGCDATVVEIEDGDTTYFVHEHVEGPWEQDDDYSHSRYCEECGNHIDNEEHADNDGDGLCDGCGFDGMGQFIEVSDMEVMEAYEEVLVEALTSEDPQTAMNALVEEGVLTQTEADAVLKAFDEGKDISLFINYMVEYELDENETEDEAIIEAIEAIKAAAGENTFFAEFIDITLYREIWIDEEPVGEYQVSQLPGKMQFAFRLPFVPETEDGEDYKWYAYRYHDGEVEILEITVLDEEYGSFESDKFSVYGIGYGDGTLIEEDEAEKEDSKCSHKLADGYRSDSENHWRYCKKCGDERTKRAHVDANSDNRCDVCDYTMAEETVETVMPAPTTEPTAEPEEPVEEETTEPTVEPEQTPQPTPEVQEPSTETGADNASSGGIAVGVAAVAAILALIIAFIRKRKKAE